MRSQLVDYRLQRLCAGGHIQDPFNDGDKPGNEQLQALHHLDIFKISCSYYRNRCKAIRACECPCDAAFSNSSLARAISWGTYSPFSFIRPKVYWALA